MKRMEVLQRWGGRMDGREKLKRKARRKGNGREELKGKGRFNGRDEKELKQRK